MTDRYYEDLGDEDPSDDSIAEVVNRVKESQRSEAIEIVQTGESRMAEVLTDTSNWAVEVSETERRRVIGLEGRAAVTVRLVGLAFRFLVALPILIAALDLIFSHRFDTGIWGTILGISLTVFVLLEAVGIIGHLSAVQNWLETKLTPYSRKLWLVDATTPFNARFPLGLMASSEESTKSERV